MSAVDRPTVVVSLTNGILNVVCADAPVRVILVDYDVEGSDDYFNTKSPEGVFCRITEKVYGNPVFWHAVDAEKVAEFEHALAAADSA